MTDSATQNNQYLAGEDGCELELLSLLADELLLVLREAVEQVVDDVSLK